MEKDNVYVLFDQKAGTPTDGQAEEVIPTCVRHITGIVLTSGQAKYFLFWSEWGWYAACPYGEISDFGSPTGNMQTMP